MKRVRAGALTVGVLACAAALLPLSSSARLPKPTSALIVPFASIDGVSLGTSKAKALERWGPADQCVIGTGGRDTCVWIARSATDFPAEAGVLELAGGRVCGMLIRAGSSSRAPALTITRLKKWKTKEGVGLGSTLRAAKRVLGRLVVERRGVTTAFQPGFSGNGRQQVANITIYRTRCPVT
jgi:hypothetical protein